MDAEFKENLWHQFGAAIDMMDRAIVACPEALWSERGGEPEYWYLTFHTLFWLDYYLSESLEGFAQQAPVWLAAMDPAGGMPPLGVVASDSDRQQIIDWVPAFIRATDLNVQGEGEDAVDVVRTATLGRILAELEAAMQAARAA